MAKTISNGTALGDLQLKKTVALIVDGCNYKFCLEWSKHFYKLTANCDQQGLEDEAQKNYEQYLKIAIAIAEYCGQSHFQAGNYVEAIEEYIAVYNGLNRLYQPADDGTIPSEVIRGYHNLLQICIASVKGCGDPNDGQNSEIYGQVYKLSQDVSQSLLGKGIIALLGDGADTEMYGEGMIE